MPFIPVDSPAQLNEMFSAGSNAVTNAYQQFRQVFPNRNMMEVGLTDTFITQSQRLSSAYARDAFFIGQRGTELLTALQEWINEENTNGCDFVVKVNSHQTTNKHNVLFQAKVAKKDGTETYADFLYESKKSIGRFKVLDYQNKLLAECAKKTNSEAYYVIYDEYQVWWVNAIALENWLDLNEKKWTSNVKICVEAFHALAQTSYLAARGNNM